MVVLIDTNVIINFLAAREPFYEVSSKVMEKCANRELKGYIAYRPAFNSEFVVYPAQDVEEKRRK